MTSEEALKSENFYSDLPAAPDFSELAEASNYTPLPDDWTLVVTDVVGSTKAIEDGNYKSVNMVGAASIISVTNIAQGQQLPFVFGGDGSLIAVPPQLVGNASDEIRKLQAASQGIFGLSLRAAAIPVSALRSSGANTSVSKYHLAEGNFLAMFGGTGPAIADEWLKEDEDCRGYALKPNEDEEPANLDGLSCRWEPLTARNGTMLTVILMSRNKDRQDQIINVADAISDILGKPISSFAPAHDKTLRFRFPPAGLKFEIAANRHQSGWLRETYRAYFTSLMQYLCERFGITLGDYNGAVYREELKARSDYRKYDGSLRMVLDVSREQANEIEQFLESKYQSGEILYGVWSSDRALMTCLLFSLADSQHVHFIDGADGGYAMAAKRLKDQIKKELKSS